MLQNPKIIGVGFIMAHKQFHGTIGKKSDGITHPIESNGPQKRKAGFYGYAMGSAMSDIPGNEANAAADVGYATSGGCDGGAPAAGESVDLESFNACLEAVRAQIESNPIANQIADIFKKAQQGQCNTALYSGADGYQSMGNGEQPDMVRENLIATAAANCESALQMFKAVAGVDYWVFRR